MNENFKCISQSIRSKPALKTFSASQLCFFNINYVPLNLYMPMKSDEIVVANPKRHELLTLSSSFEL